MYSGYIMLKLEWKPSSRLTPSCGTRFSNKPISPDRIKTSSENEQLNMKRENSNIFTTFVHFPSKRFPSMKN